MKKFVIISLAGILAVSIPGAYAGTEKSTFDECHAQACFVDISVVEVGGVKTIVANPEILLVAHRGNDKSRRSATIIFNLTTADYSFVDQKGIEFNNNVEFGRDNPSSNPTRVVMHDKNSDTPKHGWHNYAIQVQDKDGNVLNLDPVVINGGGVGN